MRSHKRGLGTLPILWVVATLAATASMNLAAAEWKPDRNVEFNVGSGVGGGSDTLARTLQAIWQGRRLVRPSVTVVNKPPSIAMSHVHQQAGNPHYLMIASTTFLTSHITGTSPLKYTEFTPIAAPGEEPIIYRDDVFARTTQSEEWAKFNSPGYAVPFYMSSRETARMLGTRYDQHRVLLT